MKLCTGGPAGLGTYVGAWHLAWEPIARYQSATPYFNQRYQIMIWNELVKAGVVQGKRLPVPSLTQNRERPVVKKAPQVEATAGTGLVFDVESGSR